MTPLISAAVRFRMVAASVILFGIGSRGQASAGVSLAIERDNTNAVVSWPYPGTGFGLQFSTNLSSTDWQEAAESAVSNNRRWLVTAPANLENRFFRLKNHLQYFGFWAGSVAAAGSIIEQSGYVNFTMGAGPGPSADQAVASGMKLVFFAP